MLENPTCVEPAQGAGSQRPAGTPGSTGEDHADVGHSEAHRMNLMPPQRRIFYSYFTLQSGFRN